MEPITDHKSLIDGLGGNKIVSEIIPDCTPVRVGQWKIGNRIPVEYWPAVIEGASAKGVLDADGQSITSDWLMNTVRPRNSSVAAA
ncbi:hypothetical protein [Novosphingobium sp.]|uniref:hypothetical protein n=1 Tax=Novosphingobium sp. TaxID=1874826 RepID=UPI00286DCA17|nr:hypothetical protein [Novosphingobium sp.]